MPQAEQAVISAIGGLRTIVALELRLHARDFLAWLSVLVLFALAFAHASGGPIVLVRDLGAQSRVAPAVLLQAMAGLTAFGQVITAMTAATIALRDVGTRSAGLVLTSGLGWRTYLLSRFAATLLVLTLISLAIPAGFAAGDAAAAWSAGRAGDAAAMVAASDTAMPWGTLASAMLTLVLPNLVLVSAAFFTAATLSGGFRPILLVGLGLIALWQTGLRLVADGQPAGAVLDPFGNAALTVGAGLAVNRGLWLAVSALLVAFSLWRWRPTGGDGEVRQRFTDATTRARAAASAPLAAAAEGDRVTREVARLAPLRGASHGGQWVAECRFGWHWVLREPGFGALLAVALLNAAANAWGVAADATALVRALEFHARLFAILVATIYAGELVWRDRDVRAHELFAALPARSAWRLAARASGVWLGLLAFPLTLWVASVALPLLHGMAPTPTCSAWWLLGVGAATFSGLFVVSLAVHAAVQHKTAAHLLLIAAWVTAIAAGADALAQPWQHWGRCGP